MVLSLEAMVGHIPTASMPYVAWGQTPVRYRALAFLLMVFNAATFFPLWALALILLRSRQVVRYLPAVTPKPRSLALWAFFTLMPIDLIWFMVLSNSLLRLLTTVVLGLILHLWALSPVTSA